MHSELRLETDFVPLAPTDLGPKLEWLRLATSSVRVVPSLRLRRRGVLQRLCRFLNFEIVVPQLSPLSIVKWPRAEALLAAATGPVQIGQPQEFRPPSAIEFEVIGQSSDEKRLRFRGPD